MIVFKIHEIIFFNSHLRIWSLILEREEGKRERETLMGEENIHQLPLTGTLTGAQTLSPGMCPDWTPNCMMFQPSEQPGQDWNQMF